MAHFRCICRSLELQSRRLSWVVGDRLKWALPSAPAILLACASLLLPLSGPTTARAQAQSKERNQPEWKTLQSPQEIPDYIAWKHFFYSVDWQYRLGAGFYYGFINLRLKLGPLFQGNREVGEKVAQTLADRAALACREEERFESEGKYRRRFREMGALTAEELASQDHEASRRKILAMERACQALHDDIMTLAPRTGSAVWSRIYEHVQTDVKSSSFVAVEGGGSRSSTMLEFRCPR